MQDESVFLNEDSLPEGTLDSSEVQKVAEGGTSICFKKLHHGKWFFEKHLKDEYFADYRYRQAFVKEFELGIQLEHPNIVRYVRLDDAPGGHVSICMDFVDGESLDRFVSHYPHYFQKKKNRERFLRELFSAVEYLHNRQILHLDLKPENILMTTQGHCVKLIDLGFAYQDSFYHYNGYTNKFAAPEQKLPVPQLTTACDIYALGQIAKLYGLLPTSVLSGCLEKSPKKRIQTIEQLKERIARKRTLDKLCLLFCGIFIGGVVGLLCYRSGSVPMSTLEEQREVLENETTGMPAETDTMAATSDEAGKAAHRKEAEPAGVKTAGEKDDELVTVTYMGRTVTMTKLEKRRGDSIVAYPAGQVRKLDSIRKAGFRLYLERMAVHLAPVDSFLNCLVKDSIKHRTYSDYGDILRMCYRAIDEDPICTGFRKDAGHLMPYSTCIDSIYTYYRNKGEEIGNFIFKR